MGFALMRRADICLRTSILRNEGWETMEVICFVVLSCNPSVSPLDRLCIIVSDNFIAYCRFCRHNSLMSFEIQSYLEVLRSRVPISTPWKSNCSCRAIRCVNSCKISRNIGFLAKLCFQEILTFILHIH